MLDSESGAPEPDRRGGRSGHGRAHAIARALPDRINADPERVEQGLARLVLTVIELLGKCWNIRQSAAWMEERSPTRKSNGSAWRS